MSRPSGPTNGVKSLKNALVVQLQNITVNMNTLKGTYLYEKAPWYEPFCVEIGSATLRYKRWQE